MFRVRKILGVCFLSKYLICSLLFFIYILMSRKKNISFDTLHLNLIDGSSAFNLFNKFSRSFWLPVHIKNISSINLRYISKNVLIWIFLRSAPLKCLRMRVGRLFPLETLLYASKSSAFRILVYNDSISKEKRYELSETNSIGYLPKEVLVSSTTMRFLQQLVECGNQHIRRLLRYDNSFNLSRVFTNYPLYVFYDFR